MKLWIWFNTVFENLIDLQNAGEIEEEKVYFQGVAK